MNFKKLLAYLTVYAIVILSVPFFFNSNWLKDFPELKTYDGALQFSSDKAYENLRYITVNFPKRTVGSENAESSANWISQEFKQLGLETRTEEFTCLSPEKLMDMAIGGTTEDKANKTPEDILNETPEGKVNELLGDKTNDSTGETIDKKSDKPKATDDGIDSEAVETGDQVTGDVFDLNSITMNRMFNKVKGINVIGVSKGKSNETIIIGAHRDTYGTIEGAQDNASGTVLMLELARVLTKEEHYYTYMFISFDGEEIGLKGSEAFAQKHSLKNVKLAMILDCVGYKDADTAGLYQFASSKGASPLWTTALANKLIKDSGRKEYYLDTEGGFDSSNMGIFTPLMNKMVSQRVSGDVNTDSGPFVDRNIPAVGFIAANSSRKVDSEKVFHSPNDSISNISKDTIDFIGKLSEQYIKSVELNDFPSELKSNMYLVMEGKYLDFKTISVFMALMILACLLLWFISSKEVLKNCIKFMSFLRSELPWIISITALSAFFGFVFQILNFDFAANMNIIVLVLAWLLVSFLGVVIVITLRFIALKDKRHNYHEITKYQKVLLNCLYSILFIAVSLYFNVFVAIILVGSALLIMGRVGYKNTASRVCWVIILLTWFVFQSILLITCIESYIFDFLTMRWSVLLFVYGLLVAFTFVYVISTPFMPKKEKPILNINME